ncbi:MAG: hypothetical protein RLW61_10925 [Gammaproteobacteria bacterium]
MSRASSDIAATILDTPGWASALGAIAVVLGVFLTALHANEVMKQYVVTAAMPADGVMPPADCPAEELEEEGLSRAECEYMVAHVAGIALSSPAWFPRAQIVLALTGMTLGFVSIIIGGALVNYSPSASLAAVLVFGGLAGVDALQFAAVVNTGPILRDVYLWQVLLWFLIHLMMTAAAIAGRDSEASR